MSPPDPIQQLVMICHKMHQAGQQPSVGLLRNKAPFKVSVTQAIDAVKQFNSSAQAPEKPAEHKESGRIQALEKRIAALEAGMSVLEERLSRIQQSEA
ncbi:hypothetical protein [Alteromonas sp. C1M14]|uniref:hypothetical protein n=1 Tax=Alteromonas sp. C1M14 TaxID=2841567 RepID=UPI001C090446|nr:hypothetical protein [Alteromonas sp. C1M14]MBU2977845.1 hypothetical protein [Alteromonas sp. C1M14]